MPKMSTKWNGINFLLSSYGIKKKNILSFGDYDADIEMIEKSGIGIAVENGNEKIKSKAKYILNSLRKLAHTASIDRKCRNSLENGSL
jgi:hydroxymethylpyrimidine pyrophosphatase-like HAD family hydrolase